MTKAQGVSFSDLLVAKNGQAVEHEYILPDGTKTGVFFLILPDQCAQVRGPTNALIDARRQRDAAREADQLSLRGAPAVVPIEEDIEFSFTLAAIRLAGWRGIADVEYTPERAIELCRENADIASFVLGKSKKMAGFLPPKPTA